MSSWGYHINQWSIWRRIFLLLGMIGILATAWYFLLERPLLRSNFLLIEKQVSQQKILAEGQMLLQLQKNFIYKNSLQTIPLRQIMQNAMTGIIGLEITHFQDEPVEPLQTGAAAFSNLKGVMNLSLLRTINKNPVTITFSGRFDAFVQYLKVLQNTSQLIYFDSIDFDMKRYPIAVVTMKVFTLGE